MKSLDLSVKKNSLPQQRLERKTNGNRVKGPLNLDFCNKKMGSLVNVYAVTF